MGGEVRLRNPPQTRAQFCAMVANGQTKIFRSFISSGALRLALSNDTLTRSLGSGPGRLHSDSGTDLGKWHNALYCFMLLGCPNLFLVFVYLECQKSHTYELSKSSTRTAERTYPLVVSANHRKISNGFSKSSRCLIIPPCSRFRAVQSPCS